MPGAGNSKVMLVADRLSDPLNIRDCHVVLYLIIMRKTSISVFKVENRGQRSFFHIWHGV